MHGVHVVDRDKFSGRVPDVLTCRIYQIFDTVSLILCRSIETGNQLLSALLEILRQTGSEKNLMLSE